MLIEFIKFILYLGLIIIISKYILVKTLRKLAENLNLKPKTIGNIAGYATSVPELLTIVISSLKGFSGISIYNILSSNVINFIQYLATIFLNKNQKLLKNQAIRLDIFLVLLTIIIPILLLSINVEFNLIIIPLFIILYVLFRFLNNNAHKVYLESEDKILQMYNEKEEQEPNVVKTILCIFILLCTSILLYVIGDALGNSMENLSIIFKIPEFVLGIVLGLATSVPELITFFESQKHYKENNSNNILGVVEATNNLLTSNILNLFIIQTVGILIALFV